MSETKPLTMTPEQEGVARFNVSQHRTTDLDGYLMLTEIDALRAALAEAQSDRDEARGRYKLLASAIHDHEGDCLPGCNSYGHEDGCPTVTEAITLERQQRALAARDAEIASLRLRYREAVATLDRLHRAVPPFLEQPHRVSDTIEFSESMSESGRVLSTPEAQAALKEGQL